jgi:hypothetical protein
VGFPLVPRYDQSVIRQALSVRAIGRQALTGGRVIETDGQMIDLRDVVRGEGVNILNDLAWRPDIGGVVTADRGAIGLTADKTVGSAEVDEDGVGCWDGGGGLPEDG